jgi:hypothetical protein
MPEIISNVLLIVTAGTLLIKTFSLKRDINDLKFYVKEVCKKLNITCILNGGK